jgi:hypothetical protein
MSVKVKRATLWTINTANSPGMLASTLSPLADRAVNLDLVMGYTHPDKQQATIEVFPLDRAQAKKAGRNAGFNKSAFPCVSVTGANKVGLGRHIAAALSDAGININFFIAQVVGKQYTGMFSFEAESEADLAVTIIRDATRRFGSRKVERAKSPSRRVRR